MKVKKLESDYGQPRSRGIEKQRSALLNSLECGRPRPQKLPDVTGLAEFESCAAFPNPCARGRAHSAIALLLVLALPLAGCVATPHTTIQGSINGSPFLIKAPKDGELSGFELTADTNGVIRVRIEHLTVRMNPDVVSQAGNAQIGIIKATGEVASGITAAAVTSALKR